MTDPVERIDLLPASVSTRPREIAIQDADAAIEDLDTDLPRRIGGPDIAAVPAPYLPARAWARSVDVYDPAWPEDVKRAVIVAAPQVHLIKGSPSSIEKALDALKISAKIVQWWETTPPGVPYTFKVTAYARARIYGGDVILDPRLIRIAFTTVMRTKPLTRAFDFAVGANFRSGLGVAGIAVGTHKHRAVVRARSEVRARDGLGLAAIAIGRTRHRAAVKLVYAP